MFREILATALPNDWIITPNRRLATRIKQWHQQQQDTSSWAGLNVLAIQDWINHLWANLGHAAIIDATQSTLLWQHTINQITPELSHQKSSLGKYCQQAHDILHQWLLDDETLFRYAHNDDHRQLITWLQAFDEQLDTLNCITDSQCVQHLTKKLQSSQPFNQQQLFLYGFNDIAPSLQRLLDQCSQQIKVTHLQLENLNQNTVATAASNNLDEWTRMAHWAKQQAEKGQRRIGCVVPQMNQYRDQVDCIFQRTLSPSNIAYNLSSGLALNRIPMIQAALGILKTNKHRIDVSQLNTLLLSPYLHGNVIDHMFAAKLSQLLLNNGQPVISQQQLISIIEQCQPSDKKNSLRHRLTSWLNLDVAESKLSKHDWLKFAITTLNTIGWPGQRGFSSEEHQTHQHWQQCLQAFLTSVSDDHQDNQAHWSTLDTICQLHLFQPKTDECAIQVLGALEAAGNDFDCLWISGLNDQQWPPAAKPNPLLPYALQRDFQLPHANAEREWVYCQQLTEQMIRSSKQVIISYAQSEQGISQHISPITAAIPNVNIDELVPLTSDSKKQAATTTFTDTDIPSIGAQETIRGGSWILSQQANCPFQAFAHVRLKANALESLDDKIDALDKGSLVHSALDFIWQQLTTHQQLLALDDNALSALIDQAIKHAFDEVSANLNDLFSRSEYQRLSHLLQQWLSFEKQRDGFEVIATEQRFDYTINQLNIHLVVDRIDRTDSGHTVVIDYKSSTQSIGGWLDERLTSPQLPVYATMPDVHASAICFAEVKRGKFNFRGIGENDVDINGIKTVTKTCDESIGSWSQLIQHWKQQLINLASEFVEGDARIKPSESSSPCLFCDLQPVCRINQS